MEMWIVAMERAGIVYRLTTHYAEDGRLSTFDTTRMVVL